MSGTANTPAAPLAAQPRVAELEILRGVAIVAVVGLHTTWPYLLASAPPTPTGAMAAGVHLACGFGVPLFLALSALGLALRHPGGFQGLEAYGTFLAQRARRLLPAYAFWSIATVACVTPQRLWPPQRALGVLVNGSADAQFYFIPLIFALYLAWPVLRLLSRPAAAGSTSAVLVVAAAAVATVGWWRLHAVALVPQGAWAMLPLWLVYVAAGIAVAPRMSALAGLSARAGAIAAAAFATVVAFLVMLTSFQRDVGLEPVPFAISATATIFQVRPMLYILAASMLVALLAYRYRSSALARVLERFGAHSYGIFLVHMLVLRALFSQWSPAPELLARTPWWLVAAIMAGQWAVCAGASYALVAALARIGPLSRLVSNR